MKKLFCILISSVLLVCAVFALAGCGPKSQKDNKLTQLHIREFTFLNINFRTSLSNKQGTLQVFFVATRQYSTERLYAEV